ncbi:tripartite tricarboxylate transporter permease [Pseudalkalibacillus sp. A8]|uniref:tripartite tricarboxylate transporter permease n=1 Tax=Pseudalkalibacillus sp. A8 TaxID=3382641 RepID=UPI0038B45229
MEALTIGMSEIFTFGNLFALFAGVAIGLVVGTLPGLNDNITIAILIPITFGMDPQIGMMLLVGIYCATCFGGSFPAILLKIPGTASSIVTTFDGYEMAKRGEPGKALGISTVASTIGGLISGIILITLAPVLAAQALKFGPVEYTALTLLGLSTVVGMAKGNVIKSSIAVILGLLIAVIGMSPQTGTVRFTFGSYNLLDGIPLIPLLIGLFGVTSVFEILEKHVKENGEKRLLPKVTRILPDRKLFKRIFPTTAFSGLFGSVIGVLPGAGMIMAVYMAYDQTSRHYKDKRGKFGTGVPEGIAAPEAANNAVVASSMVPLVSLGIPGNSVSALFIGALMIHGLQPGPSLFSEHPQIAYLLLGGFLVAYIFIFPLGIVMARFLTGTILKLPQPVLAAMISCLCFTGVFAYRNNTFDIWIAIAFGVIGYILNKINIPISALVLAVVLGALIEKSFQQSMVLSDGSWMIFITQPISLVLLIVSAIFILLPLIGPTFKRKKVALEK